MKDETVKRGLQHTAKDGNISLIKNSTIKFRITKLKFVDT